MEREGWQIQQEKISSLEKEVVALKGAIETLHTILKALQADVESIPRPKK